METKKPVIDESERSEGRPALRELLLRREIVQARWTRVAFAFGFAFGSVALLLVVRLGLPAWPLFVVALALLVIDVARWWRS